MSGRAFVLIFFFWALLTIITPTLVLLSASTKPGLDPKGEQNDRITRSMRMMGHVDGEQLRTELQAPAAAPATARKSSGGFRIQVAHLKSEHLNRLNRVFYRIKRKGGSDIGETRL